MLRRPEDARNLALGRGVVLGVGVLVGANVTIEDDSVVGDGCVIEPALTGGVRHAGILRRRHVAWGTSRRRASFRGGWRGSAAISDRRIAVEVGVLWPSSAAWHHRYGAIWV
jgi:hypothetical protein